MHSVTKRTPVEGFFGFRPNVGHLKTFGLRICVKRSGKRSAKLDKNNFTGIFLGYTATDSNIEYLDLTSGTVKRSHHAQFDEAWYLQPTRPPAAQLLYDLGIEPDEATYSGSGRLLEITYTDIRLPGTIEKIEVAWPPLAPGLHLANKQWLPPSECFKLHLPLRMSPGAPDPVDNPPRPLTARAALLKSHSGRRVPRKRRAIDSSTDFGVSSSDMHMVYMSPDPYHDSFEQPLDLRKFAVSSHPTAGLDLYERDERVHLKRMTPGSPAAKIPDWRTRLRGAWLIRIGDSRVSSIDNVWRALADLVTANAPSTVLLFSHPEVRPNLSHDGILIVSSAPFSLATHDQLNFRWEFSTVADYLRNSGPWYEVVNSGDVRNMTTRTMRLTRGKLLKQADWSDWQSSEPYNWINTTTRCLEILT